MNGVNWTSLLSGIITVGSAVSMAAGYPALGAIISDPHVAQALTAIITGISGLYSTLAPALMHSTTMAAAATIAKK